MCVAFAVRCISGAFSTFHAAIRSYAVRLRCGAVLRCFACEQGAGVGVKKSSTKSEKSAKRKAPTASKKRSNPDGGATTGERIDPGGVWAAFYHFFLVILV